MSEKQNGHDCPSRVQGMQRLRSLLQVWHTTRSSWLEKVRLRKGNETVKLWSAIQADAGMMTLSTDPAYSKPMLRGPDTSRCVNVIVRDARIPSEIGRKMLWSHPRSSMAKSAKRDRSICSTTSSHSVSALHLTTRLRGAGFENEACHSQLVAWCSAK